MDEFLLTIDPEIFRKTNLRWNELRLNDPWSVGYVSRLIEERVFSSKEEWENYYYETGDTRKKLIGGSVFEKFLNDETVPAKYANLLGKLSEKEKVHNHNYGRTLDELKKKGAILYQSLKTDIPEMTEEIGFECVRFRVICETWNGIVLREKKTLKTLYSVFPDLTFRKTTGDFDYEYGVDYEALKHDNTLLFAIQIKPQSYIQSNASYIEKARSANKEKNQKYLNKFGAEVYTIVSTTSGNIINNEVLFDLIMKLSFNR